MAHEKPAVILLVEDDPDDQEITRRAFKKGKLRNELYVVQNGEEAMDFLRHQGQFSDPASAPRPDLILLDLNMPRMDGREVMQELQRDPSLSLIPVVVLTTSRQDEEIIKSYRLGCKSFIAKPVDLAQFSDTIMKLEQYWFEVVVLPKSVPGA